ncbi:MAG TPA: hypothetical protein VHY22_03470 [Chthoniobacteraceae bacterium]|jgi:hypothetical protein|nr:hypothetical protein [Chthoniobacteraceae bacterium]
MKKLLILAAMTLAGHALYAGQPAAATVVTHASGATAAGAAYLPKNKSVFTGAVNDHNPFWPIGWVKINESESDAAPIVPHIGDFTVTSILLNEPPLAVINGKEMAEGEIASIPISTGSVTVQLLAVQDGRVILRWENQNLVVPLRRDEDLTPIDLTPTVGLR